MEDNKDNKDQNQLLKKQNINYRPDIKYTDDYYSEIDTSNLNNDSSNNTPDTNKPSIDLDCTDNIVGVLPGDLSNIVNEIFGPVKDIWDNDLKDKEYSKIPSEDDYHYEYEEPEDNDSNKDDSEEDFEVGEDDFLEPDNDIVIVPDKTDKVEIIEKEYVKNLTDIIDDYNQKLNMTLANFWMGVAISFKEEGFKNNDYIWGDMKYSSSEVRDNYKHLLDYTVARQTTRMIKIDYYANQFNMQSTVMHLKQVKVCYELRKRYVDIEVEDTDNKKNDGMNENILRGVNIMYDIKYDKALENLYRYLDSSVLVLDDVLKTQLQEIKSKKILLESKGIK